MSRKQILSFKGETEAAKSPPHTHISRYRSKRGATEAVASAGLPRVCLRQCSTLTTSEPSQMGPWTPSGTPRCPSIFGFFSKGNNNAQYPRRRTFHWSRHRPKAHIFFSNIFSQKIINCFAQNKQIILLRAKFPKRTNRGPMAICRVRAVRIALSDEQPQLRQNWPSPPFSCPWQPPMPRGWPDQQDLKSTHSSGDLIKETPCRVSSGFNYLYLRIFKI